MIINLDDGSFTPYSRKNWKEMKQKIHNFFTVVESDFRLLHKPLLIKEVN